MRNPSSCARGLPSRTIETAMKHLQGLKYGAFVRRQQASARHRYMTDSDTPSCNDRHPASPASEIAMSATQTTKAAAFQALHRNAGTFVIANAWDGGSARILQSIGFSAIATSSGAAAGVLGRLDGKITRDEALSQVRTIVAATDLPVSADLENGFGDTPEIVAETVRLAADAGLAGCSIEDATGQS